MEVLLLITLALFISAVFGQISSCVTNCATATCPNGISTNLTCFCVPANRATIGRCVVANCSSADGETMFALAAFCVVSSAITTSTPTPVLTTTTSSSTLLTITSTFTPSLTLTTSNGNTAVVTVTSVSVQASLPAASVTSIPSVNRASTGPNSADSGTSIASPRPTGLTGRAIGGIVGGILGAVLLVALAVIIYLLKSRKMPPDTAEIEPEEREELTGAPGVEGARPNLEKTPGGRLRYQTQDVATGGRLDNAV